MAETTTRIYELQVKLAQDSLAQLKRVQSSTAAIEKQFSAASSAVEGFAKSLLPALSVGALTAFVSKSIEAAAALDDLSEKTGASVENLSVLQQVARISGTDMGVVEGFLVKLNKALHESDEAGKDGAAALKAVGLSLAELRAMDPAEAMKRVALAFNQFADSGAKTAAIMALTGKNAAEALPFMRDLATEQGIAATVTKEQAAQAEELQKSMRRLENSWIEGAQALARELIPMLQKATDEMQKGIQISGGFWRSLFEFGTINPFKNPQENIRSLNERLEKNQQLMAKAISQGRTGVIPGYEAQNAAIKRQIEFLKMQSQEQALALLPPHQRRDTRGMETGDKELKFQKPGSDAEAKKEAERQRKEREAGIKSLVESIDVQIDAERELGLALNDGKSGTEAMRLETEKRQKQLDELTGHAGTQKLIDQIALLDDAYTKGEISLEEYMTALTRMQTTMKQVEKPATDLEKMLESIADKVDGYAKSISDSLVDFASGADDAAKSFSDMATSILRDMAKMATQMLLIEPLMTGFKGWLKTSGGSLFTANALGGVYDSPSLSKYSGGVYDKPKLFSFAQGGVFAEAGPEAIMPLKRGSDGSLGVDASGSGVVVNVYNESKAEVTTQTRNDVNGRRVIELMVKDAVSAGFRSGAFDGVMGSTYGLNRQGAR
jgi:lambda family phage tail tape measure protein